MLGFSAQPTSITLNFEYRSRCKELLHFFVKLVNENAIWKIKRVKKSAASIHVHPRRDILPETVSFREALGFWFKIGCISFGGPAAQISLLHQELVERRRWISEKRFMHALNYCMLLPGPEAQQLATYIGWLLHRTRGGIAAGALFVLPSLVILIVLSWLYVAFGDVPVIAGLFYGIKPAVTAIVLHAAYRIGARVLTNHWLWGIAITSLVAVFVLAVPFPAVVAAAAGIGYLGGRIAPGKFETAGGAHAVSGTPAGPALIDDDTPVPKHAQFRWQRLASVVCVDIAVGAAAWHADRSAGLGTWIYADGMVFHQSCAADLRGCIRGAALCLSGCGCALRLADADPDD